MKQILIEFAYDETKLGYGWPTIGNVELLLHTKRTISKDKFRIRVIKRKKGDSYD